MTSKVFANLTLATAARVGQPKIFVRSSLNQKRLYASIYSIQGKCGKLSMRINNCGKFKRFLTLDLVALTSIVQFELSIGKYYQWCFKRTQSSDAFRNTPKRAKRNAAQGGI